MQVKIFSKHKIFMFITILIIITSCIKKEEYPDIPSIEFENFIKLQTIEGVDSLGVLIISYKDGDGNIGLNQEDTLPPFDYNFFISYFEKRQGVFKKIDLQGVTFNSRLPYVLPEGEEKAVKGEIYDTLFINNKYDPEAYPDFDTIYFEAYILDRDLNKSNVIKTPEIIVNKKPIIN